MKLFRLHRRGARRTAAEPRADRQAHMLWRRRSTRHLGFRVLHAVTRGCQIGSCLAIVGYVAIDFTGFLQKSDYFTVPHITVRGNTRVTSDELLAVARLAPSIDLWAWPLADIQARVELHPRVREARVLRSFPDQLILEVDERVPVALLLSDALFEVDGEGVILGPYERGRSPAGPIITGADLSAAGPGVRVDDRDVHEALHLITSYQASPANGRVAMAEVALGGPAGPVVWLEPGLQVPCPGGMERTQWARLDAVLNDLRARGTGLHRVAAIDLRFAHIVPVRMRTVAAG